MTLPTGQTYTPDWTYAKETPKGYCEKRKVTVYQENQYTNQKLNIYTFKWKFDGD